MKSFIDTYLKAAINGAAVMFGVGIGGVIIGQYTIDPLRMMLVFLFMALVLWIASKVTP